MAKPKQTEAERESLQERIHEFRQVFDIFDKDRDGALSLDEVKPILEQMGHTISHSELHRVLEEFDSNRNGKLEFTEFLNLVLDADHHQTALIEAFRCYDHNGDGHITYDELRQVLQQVYNGKVSDKKLRKMLQNNDMDGDGKINFTEFSKMLTK